MAHEGHNHEHHCDYAHAPNHRHEHDHDHEHPAARAEPLAEGAGAGKVLFLDAFSGIAGDMTIAALLDLGVPLLVVERAIASLPIEGFHIHRDHIHRSGIVAARFDVHLDAPQPERTYQNIDAMLATASLASPVKALARQIFRRLAEAEAEVHRMPLNEVHFHEVGAVDAIVDIVGAAACFVYLGADVVASPLPMGHGLVKARHGVLPLPAPATVLCLKGVPTYSVPLEAELVTPTGAAMVATVAKRFERWPSFAPERVGWGAGWRELPDRPNLLRAVLGAEPAGGIVATGSHVILEANIDDMTGELAGHTIEALLGAGALDAWATPITMKKGRPGLMLSALAEASSADMIATVMLRESTTLGVRRLGASRTERPRRIDLVETPYGRIPVKISEGPYGPPTVKPEFDACARVAAEHGVPVREVLAAALARSR
ncbi:MAG: nickel pincer cofactor biosynthesis protein LarC [Myxococcales bacterium]|nr:nickel pincer cofactor biosynthesis protein LarC [Polyangiaceae bacterium]MDW8249202.1 nickel pincer cofactor biosynthesis protein LarC [Myxococcales bacterium]